MINLEKRLRREMEVTKVNMVPLDLQGQASELIRDEQIEGCMSIRSNLSMSDLHSRQQLHENPFSPSEKMFSRNLEVHLTGKTTNGKRLKSLKRRIIALMHKHSPKQRSFDHQTENAFDANLQSLRGTVSMSTINPQRMSKEERIRKHRSMPIGTTFSLYQEEKQRLIQQTARQASNRSSSSPPSPTIQKSSGPSNNRKRNSAVSLLASISLRSLFKLDSPHSHQQRNLKDIAIEIMDSTEELSDTISPSKEESVRRQESFIAFRYPKMAPLDYVEQASISYNLTARAHELQMSGNIVQRCEGANSNPYQNMAALTIIF